jgi:hypothetical protein
MLATIEVLVTLIFTSEVAVKVLAEGYKPYRYLSSWWNWLDMTTVAGCWISGGVPFQADDQTETDQEVEEDQEAEDAFGEEVVDAGLGGRRLSAAASAARVAKAGTAGTGGLASALFAPLRLLRLLRLLKLLRSVPQLQLIVVAFLEGLASVRYIGVLLCLAIYIYAIFGVMAFAVNDPWHFGSLHRAVITMFRCATLDAWADVMYINMYGCAHYGYGPMPHLCTHSSGAPVLAAAFFISFTLVSALVLLSLFLGVVTTSMEEQTETEAIRKKEAEEAAAIAATHDVPRPLLRLMHTAFDLLDYDKSGSIDADELEVALESLGVGESGGGWRESADGEAEHSNAKEIVAEVLRLMGANSCGQITRPSFIRFVLQTSQRQHEARLQQEEEEQKQFEQGEKYHQPAKKVKFENKPEGGAKGRVRKGGTDSSPRRPFGVLWHANTNGSAAPIEFGDGVLSPMTPSTPPSDMPLDTNPLVSRQNAYPLSTPTTTSGATSGATGVTSSGTSSRQNAYPTIKKPLYHKQPSSLGSLADWCQTPPKDVNSSPSTVGASGSTGGTSQQAPAYATVRKPLRSRPGPGQLQGSLRDLGVPTTTTILPRTSSPSSALYSPSDNGSDGTSSASASPDSLLSSPGCSPSALDLSHRVDFEV